MMDRIDAMRIFLSVLDEGSLAAAARVTGRSAAGVTRAIALLESHAGTALLHRTTRTMRLTDAGDAYADTCRHVLVTLDAADRLASGEDMAPRGRITITAPVAAGTRLLTPILADYLGTHPAVNARMLLLDRMLNLVDEGIDVALRITHLPDSELVAQSVGAVRQVVCAAPAYLARTSPINTPSDLASHHAVALTQFRHGDAWHFPPIKGKRQQVVKVHARLAVSSVDAAIQSTIAGGGVARLFSYQIADAIRSGLLVPLLEDAEFEPLPVHLIAPRSRLTSAKVRAFIDMAAPRLRTAFANAHW